MSRRAQRGFTLVELMVTVAIIGLVATIAVVTLNPGQRAKSAMGFAESVSAAFEIAKQRAVSSQRFQRLEITTTQVITWQATTEGLETPVGWDYIATLDVPQNVTISAYEAVARPQGGIAAISPGDGMPAVLDFSPDGTTTTSTVFVRHASNDQTARVVVYGTAGTSFVYDGW